MTTPFIDLQQGDCLELMENIPTGSVDMILCDLPYGTTACKWDTIIPFEPLWGHYKRIIKDNGAIVLFGSEPFSSKLRLSNLDNFKNDWIWNKLAGANFMNLKTQPWKIHEIISIFCYGKLKTYNSQFIKRTEKSLKRHPADSKNITIASKGNKVDHYGSVRNVLSVCMQDGLKNPESIITFSRIPKNNRYNNFKHPTKKPVALMEYLIKTYTNEGDTVLDNCMGSGTTGVACVNLNRNFIGYELDPGYFKIAEKRIEQTVNLYKSKLF